MRRIRSDLTENGCLNQFYHWSITVLHNIMPRLYHSEMLMMTERKASSWPGTVGGNVPADPLALSLRGWGGITGAGLRGSLPARPLQRGSQPWAAGTAHITTGLLLSNKFKRGCRNDKQSVQASNRKRGCLNRWQPITNISIKKKEKETSLLIIVYTQNIKKITNKHDQNCPHEYKIHDPTYKDFKDRRWQELWMAKPEQSDETRHLAPIFSAHYPNHNQTYALDAHALHSLTSLLIGVHLTVVIGNCLQWLQRGSSDWLGR